MVTYLPDKALRTGHSWKKEENQQSNMGTTREAGEGLGPSATRQESDASRAVGRKRRERARARRAYGVPLAERPPDSSVWNWL